MTPVEIEKALADIVIARDNACKEKIKMLSPDKQTEKKALSIESGMYSLCLRGGLFYNQNDDRAKAIALKNTRMPNLTGKYPTLKQYYSSADDAEKIRLTAALYGEVWLEDQFVSIYRTELDKAEKHGDAAKIFENRIKYEAVRSVLAEWKSWRRDSGIYPELPGDEV